MTLDPWTMAAIMGMALVTYLCRGGGYWLFRQIRPSRGARALLGYLPGTLFVSYVAPALLAGGWPQWVGAVATLAIMRRSRNLGLAIFGGTAVAWVVWSLPSFWPHS